MTRCCVDWHLISGKDLLALLREVADGADPDLVYAELYANAETVHVPATEGDGS